LSIRKFVKILESLLLFSFSIFELSTTGAYACTGNFHFSTLYRFMKDM